MLEYSDWIRRIRETKPVVHCITNQVTINDCANILVAVGASPIMAHHLLEVEEVTAHADAFVCNLGATDDFEAIRKSVSVANKNNIPVVLDPVGIAVSSYRRRFAIELVENYHIDCIRGNYSEVMALVQNVSTSSGLDNRLEKYDILWNVLKQYAGKHHTIIFMTGVSDFIISEQLEDVIELKNDKVESMITRISGSGCMLSVLAGAFLSIDKSPEALICLDSFYRECGYKATRKAKEQSGGNMTFKSFFIDEISK